MWRILCERCGIKFYSYPVLLYLGILIGVIVGTYSATLHGLNPARVYTAMVLLVPVALVGARLLFIFSYWPIYRRAPRRIWRRSEGGASLYGGMALSFLISLPLLPILGLAIGAFWDAASITILVGMIFTKVGCFLNGCCAGKPTSSYLGFYLPDTRGIWRRRLPAQLLEAGWATLILLGSIGLWNRLPFAGAAFLYALGAYVLGRWGLEATRADIDTIGPLNLHRAISVVLLAVAITSFWLLWPRPP